MFVEPVAERTSRQLADELAELALHLQRGLAGWLELVAEFDRLGGAREEGFRSTQDWLVWRCGLDQRTARERVRVARSLQEMPCTRTAFADGELSYSKVRALTRACSHQDEAVLLDLARDISAEQLIARLRQLPSAPSADPDVERRVHDSRYVDWSWDDEGALHVRALLPAEDGAAFIDAVEQGAEALHPKPGTVERSVRRPWLGARRADALAEICHSGAPAVQIVIHAGETGGCAIEGGPAISPVTALRLACDATLVHAGGPDGNLGRRMRLPTPAMRNALERRDQGCRFPGCTRRHGLSPHHAEHWANGGATSLGNQAMFCRFHHRLFHDDGWTVDQHGSLLTIRRPDGTIIATDGHQPGPGP